MKTLVLVAAAMLALVFSISANAASPICTAAAATLPWPFKYWWDKLGRDDGYLGCATGQPVATSDGQGTEVRFKDGVVQQRPGLKPAVLVIALRGAKVVVWADSTPAPNVIAVATDVLTGARHQSDKVVPGNPSYITVPWADAASYQVEFYPCTQTLLSVCQLSTPVGPAVQIDYSPYQIDLTPPADGWSGNSIADVFKERSQRIQHFDACRGDLGKLEGEDDVVTMLAKLSDPASICPFGSKTNLQEVSDALFAASFNESVGSHQDPTTVLDCSRPGDYDSALWGLVRAAYKFDALLKNIKNPQGVTAYDHLLKVLLTGHGGLLSGIWSPRDSCGVTAPETENHILLIESSRYLINELLKSQGPLPSPTYDNDTNGMSPWLMRHLQLFLLRDFYETNSVPYQRYSAHALLNLADLAPAEPRQGATMVLDYLSAKFAVQSNELRRLVPYRRLLNPEILRPNEFFGEQVDAAASRMMLLAASIDRIDDASEPKELPVSRRQPRFGHAHLASGGSLLITSMSDYRLPAAIRHRITNREADAELQAFNLYESESARDVDHFIFANEGVQISFSEVQFQLTAGGVPHGYGRTRHDLAIDFENVNGIVNLRQSPWIYGIIHAELVAQVDDKGTPNKAGVRPTSLIATLGARRPNTVISFSGADRFDLKRNTCIAPNFICGLNPTLPPYLIAAGQCPTVDDIPMQIKQLEVASMGCAISRVLDPSGSATVVYERGIAQLWPVGNGKYAAMAEWVEYDGKDAAHDKIFVKWRDAPPAFQYMTLPYFDGSEMVYRGSTGEQYDATAHAWTGGSNWFEPQGAVAGPGRWAFQVVGCQPYENVLPSDHTSQNACKIWSPRISLPYEPTKRPTEQPPIACNAELPEMPSGASVLILDVNGQCNRSRYGFYVALVLKRCLREPCSDGSLYGIVEAVPAENYRDRAAYEADFRTRNGNRDYWFDTQNKHQLPSGETIDFVILPNDDTTWAIKGSSNAAIDALAKKDIKQWPRATGPFIENDGVGNVKITNRALGRTLEYDWTNTTSPKSH